MRLKTKKANKGNKNNVESFLDTWIQLYMMFYKVYLICWAIMCTVFVYRWKVAWQTANTNDADMYIREMAH